jgi:hypothetical protein
MHSYHDGASAWQLEKLLPAEWQCDADLSRLPGCEYFDPGGGAGQRRHHLQSLLEVA